MKPDLVSKVIEDYKAMDVEVYDIYKNIDYRIERLINYVVNSKDKMDLSEKGSYDSTMEILNRFKHWIENQKGYEILKSVDTRNEEKVIQRTLHGSAIHYCELNNLDISPESNTGRGPVDYKISRGLDKTVVEIKLTSNPETVHGFEVQIEEYAKSEETDNKIFVLIDNGRSSSRTKKVEESYDRRLEAGEKPATVIVIDAKPKESASKYKQI